MHVKICGITRLEDAELAIAGGADLLGFNFYPKSPRYLTPAAARAIIDRLPAAIGKVGVFVNLPPVEVDRIAREAGLTGVQLHGDEPPTDLAALTVWSPIKALALKTDGDLDRLADYAGYTLLIDAPTPEYGGSGHVGDWSLARAAAARGPILLAGGLTAANVADAIHAVAPHGVDVCSGVELAGHKGLKDPARLRAFLAAVQTAAPATP